MKDRNNQPRRLSADARGSLKKLIILLTFGACGLRFILNFLYDVLFANLGSYSLPVQLLGYVNEAVSVCALFALVTVAVYAKLTDAEGLFPYAIIMQGVSMLSITTIAYCFFVYLIAYIDSAVSVHPDFEISNFTLQTLNDEMLIRLLSISFLGVLSVMLTVGVAIPFINRIKKKYDDAHMDLSPDALAKRKWSDNPMQKPCLAFLICFVSVGLVFRIIETVTDILEQAPGSISDLIVLGTPYLMVIIYAAAGFIVMQTVSGALCDKMARK